MPNGDDKDWVRFCAAVDGFRSLFGRWPTQVRIHPEKLENIRDHILTRQGFAKVTSRLKVISDKRTLILAQDDSGACYSYKRQGFPKTPPEIHAVEWLDNPEYRGDPGLSAALEAASKDNYLGSPEVVSALVGRLIGVVVAAVATRVPYSAVYAECDSLTAIFTGKDGRYSIMPGWHNRSALGELMVRSFDFDVGYADKLDFESLTSETFAAVNGQTAELLRSIKRDADADWDRDGLPLLRQLHDFVVAVLLGTSEVLFPGKSLKDFRRQA